MTGQHCHNDVQDDELPGCDEQDKERDRGETIRAAVEPEEDTESTCVLKYEVEGGVRASWACIAIWRNAKSIFQ
jgi:hypothetical protein